jgi:GH25 family lysozyme M1 (1,4-beta-N-acetylmuramidase)
MINGIDISGWTTVKDAAALFNDQLLIDFAYIRAHDGFRDDEKFPKHRAMMRDARTKNGSVMWGPYMYLGYTGQIGSRTWTAVRGDYQAQNCWDLATAGGQEHSLPVAIDVEKNRWWDGKVFQIVPLPNAYTYCDTYLLPAIEFLSDKQGRRPVIYANPDIILNYLAPQLSKPEFSAICECPLWLASWTKAGGEPPYMASIAAKTGWKSWLIHQYAGDVGDYPGVDDVDLNRGVGTRAQWKAWIADASKLPAEGATDPVTPPPVEPPPAVGDLAALTARVDRLEKFMAAVKGA